MIHVPKQGSRPQGRRGDKTTNMESKIWFGAMDGSGRRERAKDRLNGVLQGRAKRLNRRVR